MITSAASAMVPDNRVGFMAVLLFILVVSQRDRIAVFERDLLKVSVLRAIHGFHDFNGDVVSDPFGQICASDTDLGEPSGRVTFKLPVFDLPVLALDVHVNNDM